MFIVKAIIGSFTFYQGRNGWTQDASKVEVHDDLRKAEKALLGCSMKYKNLVLQERWIEEA